MRRAIGERLVRGSAWCHGALLSTKLTPARTPRGAAQLSSPVVCFLRKRAPLGDPDRPVRLLHEEQLLLLRPLHRRQVLPPPLVEHLRIVVDGALPRFDAAAVAAAGGLPVPSVAGGIRLRSGHGGGARSAAEQSRADAVWLFGGRREGRVPPCGLTRPKCATVATSLSALVPDSAHALTAALSAAIASLPEGESAVTWVKWGPFSRRGRCTNGTRARRVASRMEERYVLDERAVPLSQSERSSAR